jgi:hypothetical protein
MDREQSLQPVIQDYSIENNQLATYAQKRFYASELCQEARELLQALVDNPAYNTDPSSPVSESISFVERHLRRLSMYPKTNLDGYMSNLKLMTSTKHSKQIG